MQTIQLENCVEKWFACSLLSAVFCQTNLELEELTAVTFPLFTTI